MLEVREAKRTVNVHALLAVGVNADGHREILGRTSPAPRKALLDGFAVKLACLHVSEIRVSNWLDRR